MMRSWFLRILKAQSTASIGETGPSGDHSLMVCSIPLVAKTGNVGWHCRHQFNVRSSHAHLGSSLSVMVSMTVQGTKLYSVVLAYFSQSAQLQQMYALPDCKP